jgi:hypothetical protein
MGVISYTEVYTSPISQARLFKALVIDDHILIPKLLPQAVKSIEIIQGDGRARSITQINFAEGSQFSTIKNRIDELNEKTYSYKYTVIEGDALADKLELIVHEVHFEATVEGGSKNKMTTKYHSKGDVVIKEKLLKATGYLLQNPDAYA